MKIGIIGSGDVARALAAGFIKHGHSVMIGSREPAKLADWRNANPDGRVGDFSEVASFGEVIVLAVKGIIAANALQLAGVDRLKGKIVIDATNPLAETAPEDGVLHFTTGPNESAMEALQERFPEIRFVKAFNSVGAGRMVNPDYEKGPPTMFICGDDAEAKVTVGGILEQFGWESLDMGRATSARAIEPLCMLWCIRGFRENLWDHAFKLLK